MFLATYFNIFINCVYIICIKHINSCIKTRNLAYSKTSKYPHFRSAHYEKYMISFLAMQWKNTISHVKVCGLNFIITYREQFAPLRRICSSLLLQTVTDTEKMCQAMLCHLISILMSFGPPIIYLSVSVTFHKNSDLAIYDHWVSTFSLIYFSNRKITVT